MHIRIFVVSAKVLPTSPAIERVFTLTSSKYRREEAVHRDPDLCRALLLELEKDPNLIGLKNYQVKGFTDDEISYHVKLLCEAGLIEAHDATVMNSFKWFPLRLTWQGHEFLDAARDDTRWNKAKNIVKDKTGALSFEVIKDVLLKLVAAAIPGL